MQTVLSPVLIQARFSPEMKPGALEWIQKLPRYIVCKEFSNREHYHTVFESTVGVEAVKKRFQSQCKALGLVSKKGQENAHYGGVKQCNDGSYEYAAKNGAFEAHAGFTAEELEAIRLKGKEKYIDRPPQLVVAVSTVAGETVLIPKKKSISMRAQFVRHMIEKGWKVNQTIDVTHHYGDHPKIDELINELTEFWENAFTTPQGGVCIEHAKWVFATDDVRDVIRHNNREALKKFLR